MTQFHEGQEVEVLCDDEQGRSMMFWRKAKIVPSALPDGVHHCVQFPDGTRAVFDAMHIRAAEHRDTFDLMLDHAPVRGCRVTWRKATQIGVEFA
jgi:hypothetical protein